MRCPLCDGPVSGGKCRDCGMPYRNDELLYHLNEDRRDHEQHASEKVKEELRKRMIPLGDEQNQKTSNGNNWAKRQRTIEAGKAKKKNVTSTVTKGKKKEKGSLRSKIFWMLSLLLLVGSVLDGVFSSVLDIWNDTAIEVEEGSYFDEASSYANESETPLFLFSESSSGGKTEYGFGSGFGDINVGTDIKPGDYRIYTNNKLVRLNFKKDLYVDEITLRDGEETYVTLKKGEILSFENPANIHMSVYFQEQ